MRFTGLVALSLAGLATAVPVYVNPNSPMSRPVENGHNGPGYRILYSQSAGRGSLTTPTPTPILPTTTGTPRDTPSATATGQPDGLSQKETKFHEDFAHWVSLPNGAEKERERWGKKLLKDLENLANQGEQTSTVTSPTVPHGGPRRKPTPSFSATPSSSPKPSPKSPVVHFSHA
jgi:hypothetical protein